MNEKETENIASYSERVKYTNLWSELLRKAGLANAERRHLEYYDTINAIIPMLFKEHRKIINEWIEKQDQTNKHDYYQKLQMKITDILADAGYLRYESSIKTGVADE